MLRRKALHLVYFSEIDLYIKQEVGDNEIVCLRANYLPSFEAGSFICSY